MDNFFYEKLKATIETMDALSQEGFSEISTLASVALKLMETPDAYLWPETIAQLLTTIGNKASIIEDHINSEAESVGCDYKDQSIERRYEARSAAETRKKEQQANPLISATGDAPPVLSNRTQCANDEITVQRGQ